MHDEGIIKKKADGSYWIISEIYDTYKTFFEGSRFTLAALFESAIEKWNLKRSLTINRNEEAFKLFNYDLRYALYYTVESLGFPNLIVESSVGRVYWAQIPWIIIRDGRVSTSARYGIYVAYLFHPKINRLYLSICVGSENKSLAELRTDAAKSRSIIDRPQNFGSGLEKNEAADWSEIVMTDTAKLWAESIIYSKKYYQYEIPNDNLLKEDLRFALNSYEKYIDSLSEEKYFLDLLQSRKSKDSEQIIRNMLWKSKYDVDKIIHVATEKIKSNEYD